ncbi:uncharacterized protein BO95DRAFT_492889 [Aspergillus brunneoviolaceus CBS 621.78]|uniref:Uncharacterized protein n=1 Tax=Aspergillus brunneoviolaceus CBS 621.78 TaxID=1450534 RepID=A0ACD1GEG2_9EURO|nr:hypothetical protein BO95DRAFT_492889 [Aspergillus brunneoviolaceus CBS 621.78]RAH47572.1 hypothetical protein BO95DRAFT_492889 [Aspergillus brunneoviolaceus CBS 621.78]
MRNPTSHDARLSSGSCRKLFLGLFSSKDKEDRTTDQPQTAAQFVNHAQGDSPSPPAANDNFTTLVPSISDQPVDISGDEAPSKKPTDLRGLWREAYEQLTCDPSTAKLIKAYQLALLEGKREDEDAGEEDFDISPRLCSVVERRFEDIQNSRTRFHLGGKEIVVKAQVDRAVKPRHYGSGLRALAWAGALVLLVGPITRSLTQDAEASNGFESVTKLLTLYAVVEQNWARRYSTAETTFRSKQQEALAQSIRVQIIKVYANILLFQIRLARHYSRSSIFRVLEDLGAPEDWKGMLQMIVGLDAGIRRDIGAMDSATLLDLDQRFEATSRELKKELETIVDNQIFDRLKIAPEAGIGAEKNDTKDKCFAGTQIGILKKIHGWIQSPGPEHIFWLYGVAGGGKSTISRTIAERCRDRIFLPETICLGASFFFDKNESQQSNATYLFPTLCQSLANCLPELKSEIRKSLEEHPESSNEHASVRMQWKNLILKPLLSLEKNNHLLPLTLIVVIDALDECQSTHNEDPVYAILELINEAHQLRSIRLKFLLTSRPQSHIFSSFDHVMTGSHGCKQALQGAETPIDQEMSHRDIKMVLKHKLGEISQRHHFGSEWPEEEKLDALFKKADGLWIYASTAWGFICDKKAKKEWIKPRLDLLLTNDRHPRERLDGMYTEVLRDVLSFATPEERIGTRRTFQAISGAIVVLHRPLSVTTLSNLLSKNTAEVRGMLESLSSVIHVAASNDSPIRLAHLSFPEFLTSKERCLEPTFQISRKEKHSHLLRHCLEALTKTLRQDICHLGDSSTLQDSIDPGIVKQEIPSHVEYACVYWVEHLRLSKSSDLVSDNGPVHEFLKTYLLHWLEALGVMGKVSEGTGAVLKLLEYLKTLPPDGSSELRAFVYDITRFVRHTRSIIEKAPLQTLKGYGGRGIDFSPDEPMGTGGAVSFSSGEGKDIISLSKAGHVRVWDVASGRLIREIRNPVESISSCLPQFSPDRTRCAGYLMFEMVLYFLDIERGTVIKWVEVDSGLSTMAFFSTRESGKVQLWSTATGTLIHSFDCCIEDPRNLCYDGSVAFSHNDEVIAAARDHKILIWCLKTHRMLQRIPTCLIQDIAFSSESRWMITSGEGGGEGGKGEVTWWNWSSGQPVRTVSSGGLLLRLSNNRKLLASVSDTLATTDLLSHVIDVWDVTSGALVQRHLRCVDGVSDLAFSNDGTLLASMTPPDTVRLWDLTGPSASEQMEHFPGNSVRRLNLLPGHKTLVVSGTITMWLWDFRTKTPTKRIGKNIDSSEVLDIWFSPGGQSFAANCVDGAVHIHNTQTGARVHSLTRENYRNWPVTFSPDSNLCACAVYGTESPGESDVHLIKVWGSNTGELRPPLKGHGKVVCCLSFSPNGEFLAGATLFEGCVLIWNLASKGLETKLAVPFTPATPNDSVFLAQDERLVGPLPDDHSDSSWSIISQLISSEDRNEDITHIVWSLDGAYLACICRSGRIWMWKTDTWTLIWSTKTGVGRQADRALAFSPDARLLASTYSNEYKSSKGRTDLWEVQTGKLIGTRTVAACPQTLRFSADGATLDTNFGRVDVRAFYSGSRYASSRDLFLDDAWVVAGNERILLPFEYRATCALASDDLLITGHASGQVTFLRVKAPED